MRASPVLSLNAFLLLSLAACTGPSETARSTDELLAAAARLPVPLSEFHLLAVPTAVRTTLPSGSPPVEAEATATPVYLSARDELLRASVEEQDRLIRRLLEEYRAEHERVGEWLLEQRLAQTILGSVFERGVAEQHPDVVAYYTEMLVRNESQRADLVLLALEALEARWSPQKRAEVARTTRAHAAAWLEATAPIADRLQTAPATRESEASAPSRLAERRAYLEQSLEALTAHTAK